VPRPNPCELTCQHKAVGKISMPMSVWSVAHRSCRGILNEYSAKTRSGSLGTGFDSHSESYQNLIRQVPHSPSTAQYRAVPRLTYPVIRSNICGSLMVPSLSRGHHESRTEIKNVVRDSRLLHGVIAWVYRTKEPRTSIC